MVRQWLEATINDEARLTRLGQRFALAFVVLLVLFAAYYTSDRYLVRVESPLEKSVRALEDAVRTSPNDAQLRLEVANAYFQQGRHDQAIAQYKEALRLRQDWQPALLAMAGVEFARKNHQQAEQIYRQIIDLNKDNDLRYSTPALQVVYYRLAFYSSQAGKHDEAAEWADAALRVDRTDADSWFLLAGSQEARGDLVGAREAYRKAVSFDPNFREGFAGLHRVAAAAGDRREAGYARSMETLAAGDVDGALAGFRRLVQESPEYAEAYQGLGLAYTRKGQRDEAIKAFRAALDRDPKLLLAQWSLGSLVGGGN